jgi:glycosyltransferase involved in cell wall biosynthesis
MKILLYLPTPGGLTGSPKRTLTLANTLSDRGFDVCLVSDEGSELLARAVDMGISVLPISTARLLQKRGGALLNRSFRLQALFALVYHNLRLLHTIQQTNADVVWTRASKGIAFIGIGAFISGRPFIWDVDYEPPSLGIVRWLHRAGLGISKRAVFQYHAAPIGIFGGKLATRYKNKIRAVIPGIDTVALEPFRVKRIERRNKTSGNFTILQVGTVCDRKNQAFLLEALNHLKFDVFSEKVSVFFIGGLSDRAYVHALEKAIDKFGLGDIVSLFGWQDDVHDWMVGADLLVMPSKDEGVPNTLQEAMYIGIPVIASDRGGMPEVVMDSRTGWVLPLNNSAEWGRKISECMHDARSCEMVSTAASEYAARYFTTENWGLEYSRIIKETACVDAQKRGQAFL